VEQNYVTVALSNLMLAAFAAQRRLQACRSISASDASAQQQIRRPLPLLSIDGTDRRTGHPTVT